MKSIHLPRPTQVEGEPAAQEADALATCLVPRRVSSATLLGGRNEVLIEHRGAEYRLRQTALGKLILTK